MNKVLKNIINIRSNHFEVINALMLQDSFRFLILIALREFPDKKLWVGGGFIRNLVWDFIHGYAVKTELGDIDVFYFDKKNIDKGHDIKIEKKLKDKVPNVNWSVKNQARMHLYNNEKQYKDLHEAISKFPETVSSIICRLNKEGDIEFIAPYGVDDLFKAILKPTPYFIKSKIRMQRFYKRLNSKKWEKVWNLKILEK